MVSIGSKSYQSHSFPGATWQGCGIDVALWSIDIAVPRPEEIMPINT